jgi:DNA-directed RNA polymerase subunit beta'
VADEVFGETVRANIFDKVTIRIASPEVIRSWSRGEVKNPETINYRTFKPESGGLFCERIFGPTKDWECNCGKYKRIKYKGIVCDRCGVEVTQSKVRRERMGHIELAVPTTHIWFFKTMPSRIGNLLGTSTRTLERVIYYEDYVVIDPGETDLEKKQLLSEAEYREKVEQYGAEAFIAKMGGEAIKDLLLLEDLDAACEELRMRAARTKSKQAKMKFSKRLKIIENFRKSGNKPSWMVLDYVPVIPPDLRPLVPLDGGRFATSDLNDLYRRVINRNNRLKNILELKTPEVIVRNEKRMLQEAVDALFDNGRHGRPVMGAGNRPLKSLADSLKGKQGRFRQNLLGKRVDYSGRSVIVVGPELKLHQCGLPKKMALELFEPFIIKRLKEKELVYTIRSAKKMIEREAPEVWDILEEVTKGHPILLNRAPTLHRLGIQAFEPVLIEGRAIRIHPLVCTAFNADFDGDQMAVHVPLSAEAQMEARVLMLAPNNIFSPSNGKPLATPTQDCALGIYYATKEVESAGPRKRIFTDTDEVLRALDDGIIAIHEKILVRIEGQRIETTAGRVIFNEALPEGLDFVNRELKKKDLSQLVIDFYRQVGLEATVAILDSLKTLGFEYATRAGFSIGIDDLIIPKEKDELIAQARKLVDAVEKDYRLNRITHGERYNKIIDIWTHTTDTISEALFRSLKFNRGTGQLNPVFAMVDSGARGSRQQIHQIAGMRGLMGKPSGEIIESPITANFREGLTVLEYFISTHGARKGLADTALKTADSGYLTRRLVDVAQDVIITEWDCGTLNNITLRSTEEEGEEIVPFHERLLGRMAAEDILNPATGEAIVQANGEINEAAVERLRQCDIRAVKVRSVLTCETRRGICAMCYGRHFGTGKMVALGESVGIIAAQSIGEPGTQLTMRTFHYGGVAGGAFRQPQIAARNDGAVRYHNVRSVTNPDGETVVLNKNSFLTVADKDGQELENYSLEVGAILTVDDKANVKKGQVIARWDPYNLPIHSEQEGTVDFHDIIEGVTMRREITESAGAKLTHVVITEHKEELHPQVIVREKRGGEALGYYSIPAGAHIVVKSGQRIQAGELLAKTPRKISKIKDIVGGLPRVAELFEARRPKDAAEIAKINGTVEFHETQKGKLKIIVRDEKTGMAEEHFIPLSKHLTVAKGDVVKKGQKLTEGPIVPQEILEVCGPRDLQEYLVSEVQEVYRLQGVEIHDKHIEIIIRQMLRKVHIMDPGDTDFLYGEQVDKGTFADVNREVAAAGKRPAEAAPLFLGITKASLGVESFISAASFQDTTRVLTAAAANGRCDMLRGFKENVIMGHVIPGGTGFPGNRGLKLKRLVSEAELIEAALGPVGEPTGTNETSEEAVEQASE